MTVKQLGNYSVDGVVVISVSAWIIQSYAFTEYMAIPISNVTGHPEYALYLSLIWRVVSALLMVWIAMPIGRHRVSMGRYDAGQCMNPILVTTIGFVCSFVVYLLIVAVFVYICVIKLGQVYVHAPFGMILMLSCCIAISKVTWTKTSLLVT